MSSFNRETYNRIRDEVRQYLDHSNVKQKSILFYGQGGEGKTYLMDELKEEMYDAGYTRFHKNGLPKRAGVITRSKWGNDCVVSSVHPQDKLDTRFKIWDFTVAQSTC